VLLEHLYERNGWGRPQITTTLGHEDSVVSGDGFSVSTRSFADTEAPPAGIVLRS
jgi:hypothetical protein